MPVEAPAKINLFLHVGDKRPDGYHALESLVAFSQVGDQLRVSSGQSLWLDIDGPFSAGLSAAQDNLVLRAARNLAEYAGIAPQALLRLTKNLPVASGIGGGSADAAAALGGLNALWSLGLSNDALRDLAAEIGSDIPVCIESVPAWMEGRGERVESLSRFPEIPLVLVNPGVSVPTGPVFAALQSRTGVSGLRPKTQLDSVEKVLSFLQSTSNDLEAPALKIAPIIGSVLEALRGHHSLLARMSGSGATCFGIFPDDSRAEEAASAIQASNRGWWVGSTRLRGVAQ